MSKAETNVLKGGPFNGTVISGDDESKTWLTRYTLDENPWTPERNMFVKDFPAGVVRHGYRKQGDGVFHHIWSRA